MIGFAATTVTFPTSAFAPLAVGFFGLGTGYLIYGPQEALAMPARNRQVDLSTGIWGIWMPGFMQLFAGAYLWAGLAWFHSLTSPPLYMAALAFTAYGVHWFALGLTRALGGDPRPNEFMAVTFALISVLGMIVFFHAGDWPVGLVFTGLVLVYLCELCANAFTPTGTGSRIQALNTFGLQALGYSRLLTGAWLMYMTFSVTLDATSGFHLPT